MFLGYQNGKIVLTANTREQLENTPCMVLDKIVETDKEYVLYKGDYILKDEAEKLKAQEQKEERIKELKQLLSNTDYKAIKYSEGLISEEEYAEVKAQRQAWRDEINQLEVSK